MPSNAQLTQGLTAALRATASRPTSSSAASRNAGARDGLASLSGPIARGDVETVQAHLRAIGAGQPLIRHLYVSAGHLAADLLSDESVADAVHAALDEGP